VNLRNWRLFKEKLVNPRKKVAYRKNRKSAMCINPAKSVRRKCTLIATDPKQRERRKGTMCKCDCEHPELKPKDEKCSEELIEKCHGGR